MAKLIAKEKFFYSGRNVEANEEFEALDQDVPLLTASFSPRARLPDKNAEPKAAPQPEARASPRYESRGVSSFTGDAQEQQKPKRTYTRRDMRPEE